MMASVMASNGNNIKFEERHEKNKRKSTENLPMNLFFFYSSTIFTGRQLFSIMSFMLGKTTKPISYDRNGFLLTRLSNAVRKS